MPDALYSQSLHDTLALNEQLMAKIKRELLKHQNNFTLTREELSSIGQQLLTLGYLATKSMETLDGIVAELWKDADHEHLQQRVADQEGV